MKKEEIVQQLKKIIEPYVQDKEAFAGLTEDSTLLQDLKINSAHLIDIILDVEEAFDIEIDDETAETMVSVKDAVKVIEELAGS
jgi:acyl carrier protein